MNTKELKNAIETGKVDNVISNIVCTEEINGEKKRYYSLLDKAVEMFGEGDYHFVSSPGRAEIGGNHTDHQHGHVLAAGLNLDNLAIVKAREDNLVTFVDPNFPKIVVDLNDLSVCEDEKNSSQSLIRGIANRLVELGYEIGGFDALCDSRVLIGSGISSSACFEVMIVEIFSSLFNDQKVDPVQRALIAQYSENVYFGKPCGLLDQLAISEGGFTAIDFKDANNPKIENYKFSFTDYGYELLIINTKGNHSDLSHEYAAIPYEIKEVAHELGVEYLADSTKEEFIRKLPEIRNAVGNDRALLRSMHFYEEDERAVLEKKAVEEGNIDELLKLMKDSGHSSYMYLQNVYAASATKSQAIALGLCLTDSLLKGRGSYRIQGGGFEGTIQAIVPVDMLDDYKKEIAKVFGDDAIMTARIRPFGTTTVI